METEENLIDFFKGEHIALTTFFERDFKIGKETKNWHPLLSVCKRLFEENHHLKEEQFIFEAIKKNSKIRSGGPLCTYFFDSHMNHPSLNRAFELTKKLTGLNFEARWSVQMKEIREKNLPLVIPGEDHESGRIILRAIAFLLFKDSSTHTINHDKIETLFAAYIDIQKDHFDREENCFFRMCIDLISTEEWRQIQSKMNGAYEKINSLTVAKSFSL